MGRFGFMCEVNAITADLTMTLDLIDILADPSKESAM